MPKAVCCFKGNLAPPPLPSTPLHSPPPLPPSPTQKKKKILGTLLSRFFEDRRPTSSISISIPKDLFVVNPRYHPQNCENLH